MRFGKPGQLRSETAFHTVHLHCCSNQTLLCPSCSRIAVACRCVGFVSVPSSMLTCVVPESVVEEKFITSCECVSGSLASSENTSTVLPAPLEPTTRAFRFAAHKVPRTNEFRICADQRQAFSAGLTLSMFSVFAMDIDVRMQHRSTLNVSRVSQDLSRACFGHECKKP